MTEFVTENYPEKNTAVALGVFDGVHRGHRAVLCETADSGGLEPWVFTFSEKSLPSGKAGTLRLEPPEVKFGIMKNCGIAHVFAPDFADVKDFSGEDFVKTVLYEKMHCRKIVCGTDFRFGNRASCGIEEMKVFCAELGIKCVPVEKLREGGEIISSTAIRAAAENGDMEKVELFSGYPFCIERQVRGGKELGRKHGLPTINQSFADGYIIPKFGVYASVCCLEGKFYPAVTNIGVKPTVSDENIPGAETNIIGFAGDLYGKSVPVFLLHYMRGEKTFSSEDELFLQIAADRNSAEDTCREWIASRGEKTAKLLGI